MVSIQPADMTNQKKRSFQAQLGKKERANKKKAEQKAMKAMARLKPELEVQLSSEKITSLKPAYLPSGEMTAFTGRS